MTMTSKTLFGRVIKVKISSKTSVMTFDYDDLEIRFDVKFDDNIKPNISTLSIYNLTKSTISKIKKNANVTINAGYRGDVGLLIEGKITSVKTKHESVDKVTTIRFKEGTDYSGIKVDAKMADAPKKYFVNKRVKLKTPVKTTTVGKNGRKYTSTRTTKTIKVARWRKQTLNITFAKGTKASTIIKKLAGLLDMKLSKMVLPRDKVYKKGFKVTGKIESKLETVVKDCGASLYWRKGKPVIRSIHTGDDERFTLKSSTGLLEVSDYDDDDDEGYSVRCLLQHRISVASIITLESNIANAKVRVKSGHHVFDGNDFVTEFEAIK